MEVLKVSNNEEVSVFAIFKTKGTVRCFLSSNYPNQLALNKYWIQLKNLKKQLFLSQYNKINISFVFTLLNNRPYCKHGEKLTQRKVT